jgi:transcriptional regulator GlxA family with amidase domain
MDRRVKKLIEIIDENIGERLSEQAMSRSINLSPARLRDLFKKETGLSPIQYVKRLRMRRAADLLRMSFLSIKEVAFQSGAGDTSHFVRDFKKQYGLTPSQFRAQAQGERKRVPSSNAGE